MFKRDGAEVHPVWGVVGVIVILLFCFWQFKMYFGGDNDWRPRNDREKWLFEKAEQVQGDASKLSPEDRAIAEKYVGGQTTRALSSIYGVIKKHK